VEKEALSYRYNYYVGISKIIMATYQVASVTSSTMSVRLPSNISTVFTAMQVMNLNIAPIFMGCSKTYTFIDELYVTTLTPIAITVLFGGCFLLEYMYKNRLFNRGERGRGPGVGPAPGVGLGLDGTDELYKKTGVKYLNFFFFLTIKVGFWKHHGLH